MGRSEPLPQLIVEVLDAMLLVQQGRKVGCAVTDDQIQALKNMYRKVYHLDTAEQWEDALRQQHLTDSAWRQMKRKQGIIQCVQRKVFENIPLTDDEAHEYYSAHLNQFTSNGETISFDQAREQINQLGDSVRRRTEFRNYLEHLRSDAVFDWQEAETKSAYHEGLGTK